MANLIAEIEAEQIAALGKTIPDFKAGDTVRVGYKVTEGTRTRVQNYEGVVIARKGGGISASFTVRKISFGEGVERVFPLYSTNIDAIEVVRRGRTSRAGSSPEAGSSTSGTSGCVCPSKCASKGEGSTFL